MDHKKLVSGGKNQLGVSILKISQMGRVYLTHYDYDDADDSWDFSHRLNSGS